MRMKKEYFAQVISVLSAIVCALLAGCKFAASGLVIEFNPTTNQVEKNSVDNDK